MLSLITAIWGFLSTNICFFACYISSGNAFPPPLSAEEENKLLSQYEKGDENARNLLIEHNLRLVAHIAKKYTSGSCDSDDLLSIGTIGLIKGINSYSLKRQTKLSTFLAKCIQNEILMYLRSGKKLQKDISLSEALGKDGEGNELTFLDIISDEEESVIGEVARNLQLKALYNKISTILDKREAYIIIHRYGLCGGEEKTQSQVARDLGISRSYVSRIEKTAISKLKYAFKE
ncbi:MAG: RNA polymerase sporulation sigma factor SigK [Clostridia bacterium]|nr:RNA polymerase sporulation sigma factor SigK [Clostridia bacterium]